MVMANSVIRHQPNIKGRSLMLPRQRLVASITLLMMLISFPMSAAAMSIDENITNLELAITPNGDLVITQDSYAKLNQEQREYIGEALSLFNNNKGSFTIEANKLRFTAVNQLPDRFKFLAIAWFDQKVDNRASILNEMNNITGSDVTPSSYYWFENFYRNSSFSHTNYKELVHKLDMPEHANLPSNKIGCESGHTRSRKGSIELSYNLEFGEVAAKTTLEYWYENFMNCNTSAQRDVFRGETGYMYWTFTRYQETQRWDRMYYEDWDGDGIADYAAYRGEELAYVYAYSSGNFDYESAPNPCQMPCSGLNCPYR